MGNKPYNRCKKCKVTGCPYKEEGLKVSFTYCQFFSKVKKEFPKKKIPESDYKAKIEERNEMNKQYE